MQEIINIFKEWPVLVQGALGSGLFWLFLILGQKVVQVFSEKYSTYSKRSRELWLINRFAIIQMRVSTSIEEQGVYSSILLYRASRFFYRSVMWLVLGLTLQVVFAPLSIVGFLGSLYYLVKSLNIVDGTDGKTESLEKELKNIQEELESIGHYEE